MVNYIDYRSLRKFYSLHEACELLGLCQRQAENVIFWRSACGGYAALITRCLSA